MPRLGPRTFFGESRFLELEALAHHDLPPSGPFLPNQPELQHPLDHLDSELEEYQYVLLSIPEVSVEWRPPVDHLPVF